MKKEKIYTMSKTHGQKWIDGLRSGKYKQQSTGLLQYKDCFCALGVFCVVNNIPISENGTDMMINDQISGYDPFHKVVSSNKLATDVYKLNDGSNLPFDKIADWIEDNVKLI